ncbi:MAG: uracil-DNA glycosylase family protein [Planctomycetota bacterium]|nr:uracil-DNA glycosylase family protein [Planctomycetota bacterium]
MVGHRDPLLVHLETAAATFGADLPLQGAEAIPAKAPEPPRANDRSGAPATTPRRTDRPAGTTPRTRPQPAPSQPVRPTATPAAARPAVTASAATDPAESPLAALRREVMSCRRCKLCENRKTVVFGEGNERPDVLFIGEAPGAVEDRTGRPFVGPSGQLLDRILANAMGLLRSEVFIANINKCRPPGNRDPEPDEVAACLPYLQQQVELLAPRVIVTLGRVAAHNLLGTTTPMRALRGRELDYQGIPVVATWHPAFLLHEPSRKRETWEDIKRVNRLLGRPEVPERAADTSGS